MANTQAAVSCAYLFLFPTLVVPPVSDHLKCKNLRVELLTWGGCLQEWNDRGHFHKEGNSLHAISKLQ